MADASLQQAAAVNPDDKFELVFKNLLESLFVERMDQNEEIFVRFMNDAPFQKVVTSWMAGEAYRRLRASERQPADDEGRALPFSRVQPAESERFVTCVPLLSLQVAAGAFGAPQPLLDADWEWVAFETKHRLRPGMFVAQVVGKSMEPAIPDGAYCVFSSPVTGTREGKTVLAVLRDEQDPETGERFTVKRYESRKATSDTSWRHDEVTLKPLNAEFPPITIREDGGDRISVVAELVEVLRASLPTP